MNQERYHRIAQKERTFIGNVRSRMARVRALREIEFEQFLDPEKTWLEDSPELVQLVERCRDEKIAAALGRHPGQQSNIRFLGSLLKMVGLKHKGQKVKSEDGDYRIYRLDRDTLSDPDRRNALQCLDRRWENYLKKEIEILNWEPILSPPSESQQTEIIENSDYQQAEDIDKTTCQQEGGYSQEAKPTQSQSGQGFDPVPRTPKDYIYTLEASWNQSDQVESQRVREGLEEAAFGESSLVARLIDSLPYCQTTKDFALQDTQPRRQQLTQWLEALHKLEAEVQPPPTERRVWQWSELPIVKAVLRWVDRPEKVRLLDIDPEGRCSVRSQRSGITTHTHISQLRPLGVC
jgi:hypothetical protein